MEIEKENMNMEMNKVVNGKRFVIKNELDRLLYAYMLYVSEEELVTEEYTSIEDIRERNSDDNGNIVLGLGSCDIYSPDGELHWVDATLYVDKRKYVVMVDGIFIYEEIEFANVEEMIRLIQNISFEEITEVEYDEDFWDEVVEMENEDDFVEKFVNV